MRLITEFCMFPLKVLILVSILRYVLDMLKYTQPARFCIQVSITVLLCFVLYMFISAYPVSHAVYVFFLQSTHTHFPIPFHCVCFCFCFRFCGAHVNGLFANYSYSIPLIGSLDSSGVCGRGSAVGMPRSHCGLRARLPPLPGASSPGGVSLSFVLNRRGGTGSRVSAGSLAFRG